MFISRPLQPSWPTHHQYEIAHNFEGSGTLYMPYSTETCRRFVSIVDDIQGSLVVKPNIFLDIIF